MKNNDNFDSKLREKLHDFEPDFEEKAWRNFAPNLQEVSHTNRFARYKKYVAYAASVTVFLTASAYMGYQNYRLSDTNKTLREKNTAYQNLIEQRKNKLNLNENKANETPQKEANANNKTQSSVENLATKENKQAENTPYNKETSSLKTEKKVKSAVDISSNVKTVSPSVISTAEKEKSHHKTKEHIEQTNTNTSPLTSPKSESVNFVISMKTKDKGLVPFSPDDENALPSQKEEKGNDKAGEKNALAAKNETQKQALSEISHIKNLNPQWKVASFSPKIVPTSPLEFPVEKPKMGIYVGATAHLGQNAKGMGAMLSFAFHPKWSANIGIEHSRFSEREFEDEREFISQTGGDFKDIVPVPVSGVTFSNINYRKTVYSLPVNIQYQQKIFSHFSAVASLGTKFLLDAQQRFRYHYEQGGMGEEHEGNFQHRPPMPMNKKRFPLVVGLGLQANVNRWQFQAMPSFATHFEEEPSSRLDRPSPFFLEFRLMRRF